MTKLRADINAELQDQYRMLASDQWHNSVHRINNYVGSVRAIVIDLLEDLSEPEPPGKEELTQRLTMALGDVETALKIPEDMRRRVDRPRESVDVNEQVRNGIATVPMPRHIERVHRPGAGFAQRPLHGPRARGRESDDQRGQGDAGTRGSSACGRGWTSAW